MQAVVWPWRVEVPVVSTSVEVVDRRVEVPVISTRVEAVDRWVEVPDGLPPWDPLLCPRASFFQN